MEVYNYTTGQYDTVEGKITDWTHYVPQGAARNLYLLYVEIGEDPTEAARKVLSKCVGE